MNARAPQDSISRDELVVRFRAGEDHREAATDASHGVTDREAVVVPERDVEQHRVRPIAQHGLDRAEAESFPFDPKALASRAPLGPQARPTSI
jgi:hypothetical protein